MLLTLASSLIGDDHLIAHAIATSPTLKQTLPKATAPATSIRPLLREATSLFIPPATTTSTAFKELSSESWAPRTSNRRAAQTAAGGAIQHAIKQWDHGRTDCSYQS